ncbi:hypothetical protein SacmaDRAFT_2531 [Saccharomonospora marina XMU15]|uniref:Uncharacterized protein n=1 Tax=Saccharomonospora marina XMU15 TaxID=882083 RepID=H5WZP2_9PSEU|nr:hypothetical protein [Saccharomonospora marina]EHR50774.1 hypothetical protein SacmaDRAFT_2531 [Saccharomonospora marina XMU15]
MKDTRNEETAPYGIPVPDISDDAPGGEQRTADRADLAPRSAGSSRPRSSDDEGPSQRH